MNGFGLVGLEARAGQMSDTETISIERDPSTDIQILYNISSYHTNIGIKYL